MIRWLLKSIPIEIGKIFITDTFTKLLYIYWSPYDFSITLNPHQESMFLSQACKDGITLFTPYSISETSFAAIVFLSDINTCK